MQYSAHHQHLSRNAHSWLALLREIVPARSLSLSLLFQVVCRVRPPVSRETHGAKNLSLANRCVVVADDKRTVTLNSKPQEKNFTFDYAAGEDSTQEELFAEVRFVFFFSQQMSCLHTRMSAGGCGRLCRRSSEGATQHSRRVWPFFDTTFRGITTLDRCCLRSFFPLLVGKSSLLACGAGRANCEKFTAEEQQSL